MEINKEDFDKIYDIGLVQVHAPHKSNYSEVKPLLQKIIDDFCIEDLSSIIVYPDLTCNPYMHLVKDIMYSSLPHNPLWDGIFRIEQRELDNQSHGSNSFKIIHKYNMYVCPKTKQLEKCNPNWVYSNHELVNEFLKDTNELYEKLVNISKCFPIILAEDAV